MTQIFNKVIDSIKRELVVVKDTERVDLLNDLSSWYLRKMPKQVNRLINKYESDTARYYARKAVLTATSLDYTKGIANAYYNLTIIEEINEFDLPALEKYARLASLNLEKCKDSNSFDTNLMLSDALWWQGKFKEAVNTLEKMVGVYEKRNDRKAFIFNSLGSIYLEWGYYEKSFGYIIREKSLTEQLGYGPRGDIGFLGNLAGWYLDEGNYQSCLNYLDEVSKIQAIYNSNSTDYQNLYIQAYTGLKEYDSALSYCNRWANAIILNAQDSDTKNKSLRWPDEYFGDIYLHQKRYNEAIEKFNSSLTFFRQSRDRNQEMWILSRLSKCHLEIKNYSQALQNANSLLSAANETGARQYIRDANYLLWIIYEHLGRYDLSDTYHTSYNTIRDTISADQSVQRLALYKAFTEIEKTKSQIDSLNKERETQQAKIQKESISKVFYEATILFFVAVILIMLLLGGIIYGSIKLKRKSEKNKRELAENELRLQKLESQRTKAELQKQTAELEMQALRAQMNPHFIFNSLNSINRFILQNNREKASEYLTKFSKLVRLILQNSQVSLITLESELESLALYLDLEALRFDYHFSHRISVSPELDISMLKVPPLIIQPYAENAIWHGLMHKEEKGHLDIEISSEDNYLYFKITDNGIGRKQATALASKSATKFKSMGLRLTAARIAAMQNSSGNGSSITINDLLNADGSPAGTEIVIKIPVIYD